MQRALVVILLFVLVVLAGCSGVFGGGGESTETLTPAAVPTDEPTLTPVPQFAPGVTGQGIEDMSALMASHGSVLQNTSFSRTSNTTTIATNGSVLIQRTSALRAGPRGEGFYFVSEQNGSYGYPDSVAFPVHMEGWSNGEQAFVKRAYTNGTTTYERFGGGEELRDNISRSGLQYRLEGVGSDTTTVTERFDRNGTTLYRIDGTGQPYDIDNTSMRLFVDDRGVIHRYRATRELSSDVNASRTISKIWFSAIGETEAPERPPWVDEAMNRTSPTPDGRAETPA